MARAKTVTVRTHKRRKPVKKAKAKAKPAKRGKARKPARKRSTSRQGSLFG